MIPSDQAILETARKGDRVIFPLSESNRIIQLLLDYDNRFSWSPVNLTCNKPLVTLGSTILATTGPSVPTVVTKMNLPRLATQANVNGLLIANVGAAPASATAPLVEAVETY